MGLEHEARSATDANSRRGPMAETAIRKLRKLQGFGLITPAACICAERYIKRHPEVFNRGRTRTVNEAVELAVESAVTVSLFGTPEDFTSSE